eukprot:SAG31_NODE_27_length_32731_cov_1443.130393_32_plen_78_part_00
MHRCLAFTFEEQVQERICVVRLRKIVECARGALGAVGKSDAGRLFQIYDRRVEVPRVRVDLHADYDIMNNNDNNDNE